MVVWSECSGASCNDGEVRLEDSGEAMPCRARRRMTCMSGSGKWCSYQGKRSMRRSWWRSMRGRGALELRQSFTGVSSGGQRDSVEGGFNVLVHKRTKQGVREVR
jgi:hypothetical protein